jgi:hypothetical protein
MTAHDETTRGAWHVDDDGCVRTRDGRDVVVAFDHRVIATDADLRAIAAVPDLLAACEAVAATTWSKNTATIIGEQVRAAIAKAKGEKP